MIHLDTNVAARLVESPNRIPRKVHSRLRQESLAVSPAVIVELQILYELGRVRSPGDVVVEWLRRDFEVTVCAEAFERISWRAATLAWARDPFDRLIAATAIAADADLATSDANILDHCSFAFWD